MVAEFDEVDEALRDWRQGDCVLGEQSFMRRVDPSMRLPGVDYGAEDERADFVETGELGFAVLTQTCDIARACVDRPFLEVCPLVAVAADKYREIEKGRRPAYAVIPQLAARRLVADLDRVMTVEKPVVAKWSRTPGWKTDEEARRFATSLARKRVRFAFPDDFVLLAEKLQERLIHDKKTVEGRALRALREIRVNASPSWDATGGVTVTFWFIRNDQDLDFEGRSWANLADAWLQLVTETGRFVKVQGEVAALEDLLAADYVDSDPLDLDHLSLRDRA